MNSNTHPLIQWVRCVALDYYFWLKAKHIDPKVRGWNMHRDKRDWEIAAAIYRIERRKARKISS